MREKKRIFVVDDEANIRSMIQMFLENEGFEVETFANGAKLITALKTQMPDMIILDIMMPGKDGLTLCEEIRKSCHIPIIFVSAKSTGEDRIRGLEHGGDDYLVKPFYPLELIVRVNALFRRTEYTQQEKLAQEAPSTLSCGNMSITVSSRQIRIGGQTLFVTPMEFDFLLYLCQRKETAVGKQDLLKNVWNFRSENDDYRAIDDLIKRLRKKLQGMHATFRIETVWGYGYRMTELELN